MTINNRNISALDNAKQQFRIALKPRIDEYEERLKKPFFSRAYRYVSTDYYGAAGYIRTKAFLAALDGENISSLRDLINLTKDYTLGIKLPALLRTTVLKICDVNDEQFSLVQKDLMRELRNNTGGEGTPYVRDIKYATTEYIYEKIIKSEDCGGAYLERLTEREAVTYSHLEAPDAAKQRFAIALKPRMDKYEERLKKPFLTRAYEYINTDCYGEDGYERTKAFLTAIESISKTEQLIDLTKTYTQGTKLPWLLKIAVLNICKVNDKQIKLIEKDIEKELSEDSEYGRALGLLYIRNSAVRRIYKGIVDSEDYGNTYLLLLKDRAELNERAVNLQQQMPRRI